MNGTENVTKPFRQSRIRAIAGICLFAGLILAAVHIVNTRLTSKGTEYGYYSAQSAHRGFYALPRDSVDVLFLGSSHCYCAFAPQILFDDYGITGWNLGSSQQSIWLSYYWLREALKTQHPKAVVLEPFYVMTSDGKGGSEPSIHWALDSMRWSKNKLEAIETCREEQKDVSLLSFLFPNVRYHERIFDLGPQDYPGNGGDYGGILKGFVPLGSSYGTADEIFSPLDLSVTEQMPFYPKGETYLNRFADLCAAQDITLILVKTPTTHWSVQEHNAIADFAAQRSLTFCDMNAAQEYEAMHYDLSVDNHDYGHANTLGAGKITDRVGELLGEAGVSGFSQKTQEWEKTEETFTRILENCETARSADSSNAPGYLSLLRSQRYVLLAAGDQSDAEPFPEETAQAFEALGLPRSAWEGGAAFTAVVRDGSADLTQPAGLLPGGVFRYEMESAGVGNNGRSRIRIDGEEQTNKDLRGIKLVVFDAQCQVIVDSVCVSKTGVIRR